LPSADPGPVTVDDTHLAPAVHHVLDALPPRHLDPHALLAAGLRMAAVGVVHGERLLDVDVGDRGTSQPGHERLDGGPGIRGDRG
jgi:hypothetical protein